VSLAIAKDSFEIAIEDNGPGIPEVEFERVFAPFFRLEGSRSRSTGGVGLGLSIARTIARGHGGDIELANLRGRGLRAVIRLPQAPTVR
jgi:signal transduction histidine kinase